MVMSRWSVDLTTLFSGQLSLDKGVILKKYYLPRGHCSLKYMSFFSFFLSLLMARSNIDHYTRECEFGILKKKTKQTKTKQKNLSAVFLTK